ncbi:hypothetical protein [Butyrivibrio sp. MC2021]|uniref:hypothetical protein n=1 Tax=Butyrivibrio sp. MC2021 TaxID=1408306 RepID=UPI00047BD772|nr:hypothetical protein [Butyrivibrio sp. MC2021]
MKKFLVILSIGVLMAFMISCGVKNKGVMIDRGKIDSVCLEDCVSGMYADELNEMLSINEVSSLMGILPELKQKPGNTGMHCNYKLVCYDADGNAAYEFLVDSSYNLNIKDEVYLECTEGLKSFCKKLEQDHGYVSGYHRTPGAQYLSMASETAKADFREATENNFVQGVSYDFKGSDLDVIKKGISSVKFLDNSEQTGELWYRISLYDKNGAGLYTIDLTHDNTVYIDNHLVDYASIADLLQELEKISGFNRE